MEFVEVKGARENNLKNISVHVPRNALVVFTGVSGSGKSSLAFGTLYAEAQRRYLESVSPYARRLFNQMEVPEVDEITGLPPAVALQQQRGTPSTRSNVGTVTTISHLLRMLFSRAGDYPKGQDIIYAEGFSPNTPEGACPHCHGMGRTYDVTEESLVPDPELTIRDRAIAAWPPAWHGQNLKDMLVTLGFNIDIPWKKLPKKDRDWILFTEEQPHVPVYAGFTSKEVKAAIKEKMEPSYHGNFSSARKYVLETFSKTTSELMKKRVSRYLVNALCPECNGKRLKKDSLSVKFEGYDIAQMSELTLRELYDLMLPHVKDKNLAKKRIAEDMTGRIEVLIDLGLSYLTLSRTTPTLSPGELQRLRLGTQVRSHLFGVVYVLDEPSAGLHPADTEALLRAFARLKDQGNSIFVVEHEIEIIKKADWIVDVGPLAGEKGGEILYSGTPQGLKKIKNSRTAHHLFNQNPPPERMIRKPTGMMKLKNLTRNNVKNLSVDIPIGVLTCFTGISGSGKSTIVTQLLTGLMEERLGQKRLQEVTDPEAFKEEVIPLIGELEVEGEIKRVIEVDQKPIGRTPRSNLATYTGLFDHVRKLFARTPAAKKLKMDQGQFSFNLPKGRCENCEGEGTVMVELLFLPSVYSPCPVCQGKRYHEKTLSIKYNGKSIADVLAMSVDEAFEFFREIDEIYRPLRVLKETGLGYLRLGQPATELSGGEAQRIKLATELQKAERGSTLYVLDEPTTGLHPSDVERMLRELQMLVDHGNTVVVIEHDMQVVSQSDWVIDVGPSAGDEGGKIVSAGIPEVVARSLKGVTPRYLKAFLKGHRSSLSI
ncbi:MAG: excinuclease ABC subunit UvrA [Bdellovibrionota bacterium]